MQVTITLELPNGTSITLGNLKAILEKGKLIDFKTGSIPSIPNEEVPKSTIVIGKRKPKIITVEDSSKQPRPNTLAEVNSQRIEYIPKSPSENEDLSILKDGVLEDVNSIQYSPGMNITDRLTQEYNKIKSYSLPEKIEEELMSALSVKGKSLIGEEKSMGDKNVR